MVRLIIDTKRHKQVFNITLEELRTGDWCKSLPDNELLEIEWKKGYLTVATADIRHLERGDQPHTEASDE